MAKKAKKLPKVKSEWKRFSKAFLKGTLPTNATTRELSKFFGEKGKPLAHKLRSRAAREKFNKLLLKYNRDRMTKEREARNRVDLRKKQIAARARNVEPDKARAAVKKYEKVLYILEAVADDIGAYIEYHEVEQMVHDNPNMKPKDIVKFIKDRYNDMQSSNPDYAKEPAAAVDAAFDKLADLMETFKTTNIDDLKELITEQKTNPDAFKKKEKAQKQANKEAEKAKAETTNKAKQARQKAQAKKDRRRK